jgi:hypothetical protein
VRKAGQLVSGTAGGLEQIYASVIDGSAPNGELSDNTLEKHTKVLFKDTSK